MFRKFIRASQSNGNVDQSSNDDVDNDNDDTNLIRGLGRANTSSIIGETLRDGNSSHRLGCFPSPQCIGDRFSQPGHKFSFRTKAKEGNNQTHHHETNKIMVSTRTIGRVAIILLSLSILANGFVPRMPQSSGLRPTFGSMLSQQDNGQRAFAMAPSADIEAEVLTTMAHVTMDFGGFLNPSKNLLRYFTVLGRVFVISADYIIDHSIHTEELMIQLILMVIAIREIVVDSPTTSKLTK